MAEKSEPSKSRRSEAGRVAATERKVNEGSPFLPPPPAQPIEYLGSLADQERVAVSGYHAPAPTSETERAQAMLERIRLQEQKNSMIYGLPHRYGWKWYPWAREFFESRNKQSFLCAANQISKSSTQIRKCIEWATNKELWPQLWGREPSLFWYLYPEKTVATAEFKLKWEREFLPRGEFKDHPTYGWKANYKRGEIESIEFNSGVTVYFKTYSQDVQNLQTGTVYAIFCDEELPEEHYSELNARLTASSGYFSMVFTATLGQDYWRRCMEPDDDEEVVFPDAYKATVSLYEAMYYEDGSPSHWTAEKILAVKATCKSHNEVQKRVYGRFIVLEGRKYPTFDATRHMKPPHILPASWQIYHGADPGSGGDHGHPAALAYVAVSPDFRQGRVFLGWRGDKVETTNDFLVKKHIELKTANNLQPTMQFYDHANKDFEMTARGMKETYLKAEKSHAIGEGLLNTLFKNDMLFIYETEDGELSKLARELSTLKEKTNKKHAKDDFIDAVRYAVSKIPWDLTGITGEKSEYEEPVPEETDEAKLQLLARRGVLVGQKEIEDSIEDEINEWNEAYCD
jgi:phage terminase large subunit-like protein